MGLAASQARLLLLTARNDKLEFQAQQIEQERLLLAQEQETIAQEYSDATTNTVYVCDVLDEDGSAQEQTLTLDSLAKSEAGASSASIIIADSDGKALVKVTAAYDTDTGSYTMTYELYEDNVYSTAVSSSNNLVEILNVVGSGTVLQNGLENGSLQLWTVAPETTDVDESTDLVTTDSDGELVGWVRKSLDSLSSVTSRYYTEDDAAAQAEYNLAMSRVNTMDTRLENKLNQIETQKTAVEQEMESVDSIISSNIERTFEYFS